MNCQINEIEQKLDEFRRRSTVNPQAETGYRRIQNEVLGAILRTDLTGIEIKFIFAVIDLSWGHNRKSAIFSMRQIAYMMNCSIISAKRAAKDLESRNIIIAQKTEATAGQGTPLNEYAFNKYFDLWHSKSIKEDTLKEKIRVSSKIPLESLRVSKMSSKSIKEDTLRESIPFIKRKKEISFRKGENLRVSEMNHLDEFTLANQLFQKTAGKDPGFQKPNMSVEAGIIKNLIYLDNRSPEEIAAVIEFADSDSYFTHTVLTAKDLKHYFSKIWVKMTAGNAKAHENKGLPKPRTYAQCQDAEGRQQVEMIRRLQKKIERDEKDEKNI